MKIGTSMGQASIGEETKAAAEVVTEVRRKADTRRLSEVFQLEGRGIIDLKGTGPMNTWFLTGRTDVGDVG